LRDDLIPNHETDSYPSPAWEASSVTPLNSTYAGNAARLPIIDRDDFDRVQRWPPGAVLIGVSALILVP
jgi:hypothetical protein